MKKTVHIKSFVFIAIAFLSYNDIYANKVSQGANTEQEIYCKKESSIDLEMNFNICEKGSKEGPVALMPKNNVALILDLHNIYPGANVCINKAYQGVTDKNGNLSFEEAQYPRIGQKELLIQSSHVLQRCNFDLSKDSTLKCEGIDNFQCVLQEEK